MKLAFRDATPRDVSEFILSSWLDASRTSYSSGLIPMDSWFETMRPIYERHIKRPDMRAVVAYEKTDPAFLYGFIIADPTEQRVPGKDGSFHYWPALVLFVFTKQNYRKERIARRLFEAVGVDVSKPFLYASSTVTASRLASKVPLAKYDPLAVRFDKDPK